MDTEVEQKDTALAETLEVPAPEVAETPESPVEQEVTEQPEETPKQDTQALRFKTIREARERAERERDEAKAELDRLRNLQNQNIQQPTTPVSPQQDYQIAPDDLVEGKHLNKYDNEIKKLRQELNNYQQQSSAMAVETRLKTQYPDFDSVVSKENIEMLTAAYPEIAATLNSSPDLYNKAASAYTMIKQFGLSTSKTYDNQISKAHQNAAKPRPIASVNAQPGSDSPLSKANAFAEGLTKEVKAQLYREMIEAKKGA